MDDGCVTEAVPDRADDRQPSPALARSGPVEGGGRTGASLSRRDVVSGIGRAAGIAVLLAPGAAALEPQGADAAPAVPGAPVPPRTQAEPGPHVQVVVSTHRLATEAGLEVLAAGGTAADAAVAVAAALSVVEPFFSSALGGEVWALYFDAGSGEVTNLDGVGPVGSLATLEDFQARVDQAGIHQAIVPGAWDGWMIWLERHGRLALGQVLAPAIRLAREGVPVSPEMAAWLVQETDRILASPSTAAIYAPQGVLPVEGDTVRQEAMAATFEALTAAYDGALPDRSAAVQAARDYFYRGPLAEAIVAVSDEGGGYLTREDLAGFEAAFVDPVAIDYRDEIRVYQNAPNSQGITMLLALNILKRDALSELGIDSVDAVHLQVEALKLALADRHFHVGDPARIEVPVVSLLSEEHAANQRRRIDMESAMAWPIASAALQDPPTDTTVFHVVDRDGNAAAVTTSLGGQFLAIGDTGIHINERMQFLSLELGNANQIAPGYKVRHTSNPYMALRGGRPFILGGNSGVDTQPQAQLQQFLGVIEFGLSAQGAIDRPRFVSTAFPSSNYPYEVGGTLQMEQGFPERLYQGLRERGHEVVVGEGIFGTANMVVMAEEGADAEVGAESRSGGTASGSVVPAAR